MNWTLDHLWNFEFDRTPVTFQEHSLTFSLSSNTRRQATWLDRTPLMASMLHVPLRLVGTQLCFGAQFWEQYLKGHVPTSVSYLRYELGRSSLLDSLFMLQCVKDDLSSSFSVVTPAWLATNAAKSFCKWWSSYCPFQWDAPFAPRFFDIENIIMHRVE